MAKFIVLDAVTDDYREIEAETVEQVVQEVQSSGIADAVRVVNGVEQRVRLNLVENPNASSLIPGVRSFCDEMTFEGWGPGCKFDGFHHDGGQTIVLIFPRDEHSIGFPQGNLG